MFTCNNWTESSVKMIKSVYTTTVADYVTYQQETGKKGTKHLQGYICFRKAKKKSTVINLLIGCNIQERRGTHTQAKKYCQKEDTRDKDTTYIEMGSDVDIPEGAGARTDLKHIQSELHKRPYREVLEDNFGAFCRYHKFFKQYKDTLIEEDYTKVLKEFYSKATLKNWQKRVLFKILEQDDREILWVWEHVGNVGKSWLGRYLEVMHGAYLCQLAKKADIAYAYNQEPIVVFDLTRSDKHFINYSVMESFKNGRLFSSKYESRNKRFPPCKVVVFSNYEPDYDVLSVDRLKTFEVKILVV